MGYYGRSLGTLLSSEPKIATADGLSILHTDGTVTVFSMERDYTSPDRIMLSISKDVVLNAWEDIVLNAWEDTSNGDVYISDSKHLWKDSEGDIYISDYSDGLHVIHPEGSVTLYTSATGQVYHHTPDYRLPYTTTGWRDSKGQFYPVSVDPVLPFSWVAKSWKDADGQLYVICSGDVLRIPRDGRGPIHGYLRSDVIDVSSTPIRVIGWKGRTPPGSALSLQTRTGTSQACWIEDFEGESPIQVSASKPEIGDIRIEEGKLVIERVPGNIRLFLETGQPKGYFPTGSIVRVRMRGIGIEKGYHFAHLSANMYDYCGGGAEDGEWRELMLMTLHQPFNRLTFEPIECERFEVDYISIERPEGWTEWVEAPDPYGSLIPDLDGAHPHVQWRALFSAENSNALPILDEVRLDSVTGVEHSPALPRAISLEQNYPNPFNARTVIPYQLPTGSRVRLEIFDVLGRKVRTLASGQRPGGEHRVAWDGTRGDGRAVASGVYLYRLETGESVQARKALLLR